jgi:Phasin protein
MTAMSTKATLSDTMRSATGFALSRDNSQALAEATETWFAATAECQREMMSFMSMRIEKDGETAREVLGCRNLDDVTAIQSRWLEETIRDYNSEMTKLMGIYTKSVNGSAPAGG